MFEEIINQLVPVVITALAGILSYIGIVIKNKITHKVDTELKKSLLETTVKYVEQVYKDLQGDEKLKMALQEAQKLFAEKGIKVSDIEMRMMIEEVVNNISKA